MVTDNIKAGEDYEIYLLFTKKGVHTRKFERLSDWGCLEMFH